MHVWLCDNAGPVWQAPGIIALGRELHNNVGLGNACGLGLSAVSSPVKVLHCFLPVCLQRVHTHTHRHKLWEINGIPHFLCVKKRSGLSLLIWMVKLFKKVPLLAPWDNAAVVLLPVQTPPQEIFPIFPTVEKLWWQTEQQHVLWHTLPCQNSKTEDHVPSDCYYREKQNNLTHPKWLFTWPRRWMSTFYSGVRGHLWGAQSCWMRLYSLLVLYIYIHTHISHFHSHALCAVMDTQWMICRSGYGQKKIWQNKSLAGALQGCVMPAPEVGGDKRAHTYDLFEFAKWKRYFTGIFLGPFHCDKGYVSVKLPAVYLLRQSWPLYLGFFNYCLETSSLFVLLVIADLFFWRQRWPYPDFIYKKMYFYYYLERSSSWRYSLYRKELQIWVICLWNL